MSSLHAFIRALPDSARYSEVDPDSRASLRLIRDQSAAARSVLALTRVRQCPSTTINDSLYRALSYWACATLRQKGIAFEGAQHRPDLSPIRAAVVAMEFANLEAQRVDAVVDAIARSLNATTPEPMATLRRRLESVAELVAGLPPSTADERFPLAPVRWQPDRARDGSFWVEPADVERLVAVARAAGLLLPFADAELVWRAYSMKTSEALHPSHSLSDARLLDVIRAHSTFA